MDFPDVTPETFPLDTVGKLMASLPKRLREGAGFLMLRGLPRDSYSDDDMARIYFGLGAYIGKTMTQSYLGDRLGHVVNVSDYEPKSRGYRKGGGQLMHTDSCDIIGLMCLRTAISGGESRISSALTVHNYLLEHHPRSLEVLRRGLFLKCTDEDGRRATRTFSEHRVPFFAEDGQGEITCYLPTGYARLAEKSGQCPFSQEESDALYSNNGEPGMRGRVAALPGAMSFRRLRRQPMANSSSDVAPTTTRLAAHNVSALNQLRATSVRPT